MNNPTVGQVVYLARRREHAVVIAFRFKRSGGSEWTLAPVPVGPKHFYITVPRLGLMEPARRTYPAHEVAAAVAAARGVQEQRRQYAETRQAANLAAVGGIVWDQANHRWTGGTIRPGDRVLYRYRDCERWETVVKINPANGRIAIALPDDLVAFRRRRAQAKQGDLRTLVSLGLVRNPKAAIEVRWLDPTGVLEVAPKSV